MDKRAFLEKLPEFASASEASRACGIPEQRGRRWAREARAEQLSPELSVTGLSTLTGPDGEQLAEWELKRTRGMHPGDAEVLPDPKKLDRLSTMIDGEGRVKVQWISERPEDVTRERAWREFAQELAEGLPRVEALPPPAYPVARDLLAAYPVSDQHLGMLAWHEENAEGESYDLRIAEQLFGGAMEHLVRTTQPASTALIALLGDIFHYDSFETVTPRSRNMLDSDTRYPKMVRTGVRLLRRMIDTALLAHEEVVVIPEFGNHDPSTVAFLAVCLEAVYEHEPRVKIDTSPQHYHYFRWGDCLIGTHHGHGAKMRSLPLIMAADRPKDWGETRHRYWWTGHIHHSKTQAATSAEDHSGCVVESFRIIAPPDAWASQQGYRPLRDMKAIVLHRRHGEVARHTVNPEMLR